MSARARQFEIQVDRHRLRIERNDTTGEFHYYVDNREVAINTYLAITQAFMDKTTRRLTGIDS